MPTTQDYEHLLECKNVIGVDYNEQENRVTVFVSRKLPPEELPPEDDVERRIEDAGEDVDLEVVDSGYDEDRDAFDALSVLETIPEAAEGREERHRPVPAGVSEINAKSTAATAGPYPARVEDPTAANWSDDAAEGDLVRLSNNHVYGRANEADFGEPIVQPSPRDGGELPDDEVGELVGYVPIEDGVLVDVAARSTDPDRESAEPFELDPTWPTAIRRGGYEDLRGEALTKSGRTTGVTSADVEATGASVRVNFGDEHGTVLLRDQLVAGPMSEGGDSGSPAFTDTEGELAGLLFAGSAEQTILNKVANVETELGVRLLAGEEGGGDNGGSDGGDGSGGNGGDGAAAYVTSFETELTVDLNGATLSFEAMTFDERPGTGGAVDATVTVDGSEPGTYWIEVNDDRRTFQLDRVHETADGTYRREVDVTVSIPDDATDSASIRIRGGPVDRS